MAAAWTGVTLTVTGVELIVAPPKTAWPCRVGDRLVGVEIRLGRRVAAVAQVVVAPTARLAPTQEIEPSVESVTVNGLARVTLPLFCSV